MLYLGEEDYNEATTHFEMALTCDDEFIPPRYEIMKILNEVDDDPKQALVQAQMIWDLDKKFMAPQFAKKIIPDMVKKLEAKKSA